MNDSKYTLHRRAIIALNELTQEEKDRVMAALAALPDGPPSEWPPRQAEVFDRDKALYLVRANPSLRLIVRAVEGQRREVMDVVRKETLDAFARAASESPR